MIPLVTKTLLNIVTPTYNYPRFHGVLKRGIESIIQQQNHHFQVRHIVVFDGDADPQFTIAKPPDWYTLEVYSSPRTAVWGIYQRNRAIEKIEQGWVWFFDHDNVYYPGAFSALEQALSDDTGILFANVKDVHRNERLFGMKGNSIIPRNLADAPRYPEVDSLNFVVNAKLVASAEWQEKWGHDFMYAQNIASLARRLKYRVATMDFVVGEHS